MSKGSPKFKELRVWQKGKDLAVYIYRITNIQKETFKDIEKGCIEISSMLSKFKIDFGTVENL